MTSVTYHKDDHGIVHLILDKPDSSANLMDKAFTNDFAAATAKLRKDNFTGVILRSAKNTFFSGGDLNMLAQVTQDNAVDVFNMLEQIKADMRYLETCGKPVVAMIAGAALGGGWELALACHYRIAVNHKAVRLGLPEVTLGLLPGGGGVTRMVRMLGLQGAMLYLTEGKQVSAVQAHEAGLVDALSESADNALTQAIDWISQHPDAEQGACQVWDKKGYRMPGGAPSHPKLASMLPVVPAMTRAKTHGVLPAPEAILACMVEGAQVDFHTATRIESRKFVELACSPEAKNIINTFWFQLNEIKAGVGRPDVAPSAPVSKVGVLGAGMMGAGIAYACAIRGIEVILKDVSTDAAEKGKGYSRTLLDKQVTRGRKTQAQAEEILARITATDSCEVLAGCELVVEAVFEDRSLKATVTQEAEAQLDKQAIFASNTSTLPITGLAEASARPDNFVGLHFFSPVDKMPLVEIICGEKTSAETLARSYDFVLQIGKTPIVVNDSRGFYTSRVFETFVSEGIAMLGEGVAPASVENAAFLSGFPVGPLAVTDEVSLTLIDKIKRQTIRDLETEGKTYQPHPADAVIDRMLEKGRSGKAAGAGFYDYPQDAAKHLWSGLPELAASSSEPIELVDLKERLLFIMAIETARCLEEKVLTSSRDANIGSVFGIGYPTWTGGTLQYINQYGVSEFVKRAQALAERYGERFLPPAIMTDAAERGATL